MLVGGPSISDLMTQKYETDPLRGKILEAIRTNSGLQEITIAEFTEEGGRIKYRGSLYIPDDDELSLRVIQEHHDTMLVGHLRCAKTFDHRGRKYFWKELRKDVDQ